MLSGQVPYAQYEGAFAIYTVFNAISSKELPQKPENLPSSGDSLWVICQACWNFDPESRMTAEQAVAALQPMKSALSDAATGEETRPKRGWRDLFVSIVKWLASFIGW